MMYLKSKLTFGLIACVFALTTLPLAAQHNALPIPAGFDFPADEQQLLKFRDNDDVSSMRKHAWNVFAGMTQPSPGGEAIWETWFRNSETFNQGPTPAGPRIERRQFSPPRQIRDPNQPQAAAVGDSLLSFVLFNKEAHDWVREKEFFKRSKLMEINNSFAANTPLEDRKIEDFPRKAITLKTVWWTVKQSGITPMPIWDFEPTKPDSDPQPANDFPDWKRIVGVDPTRDTIPDGETASLRYPEATSPEREARVVSIKKFYHFEVTAENLAAFNTMPSNQRPAVGDFVCLVGFHYTTKEIPDWIWATFWWHDKPNNGVYAQDRTNNVPGVWRNFLMDVAYSMDTPREFDGSPNSCYNPWLEARFQNGMTSNCMTCHQRAVHNSFSFTPITRGSLAPDDPFFANRTKLDFLWSIQLESR